MSPSDIGAISTLIAALAAFCTAFAGALVKIIYAIKWKPGEPKPPEDEPKEKP